MEKRPPGTDHHLGAVFALLELVCRPQRALLYRGQRTDRTTFECQGKYFDRNSLAGDIMNDLGSCS